MVIYYVSTMEEVARTKIGTGISTSLEVFYINVLTNGYWGFGNYDCRYADYFSIL